MLDGESVENIPEVRSGDGLELELLLLFSGNLQRAQFLEGLAEDQFVAIQYLHAT